MNKLGQSSQELTPEQPLNHAIRIEQQAQILAEKLKQGVAARVTRPEAYNYAMNLQKLAIQYRLAMQQKKPTQDLYTQIAGIYDTLVNNYVDYRYPPVRLIRESLVFLQKQQVTIVEQ